VQVLRCRSRRAIFGACIPGSLRSTPLEPRAGVAHDTLEYSKTQPRHRSAAAILDFKTNSAAAPPVLSLSQLSPSQNEFMTEPENASVSASLESLTGDSSALQTCRTRFDSKFPVQRGHDALLFAEFGSMPSCIIRTELCAELDAAKKMRRV